MDYCNEPEHSELLVVQAQEPFNAEPLSAALVEFQLTPEELVYCRNHGPVREFSEDEYTLTIKGMVKKEVSLSMRDIKSMFLQTRVVAALQCAGNRRNEMGAIKRVHGVGWDDGVIANCSWGGVKLCDVLKYAGIQDDSAHVCFTSYATLCQDDTYYGSSIPVERAMNAEDDVLLAFEMNHEALRAEHGGPLRLVVPGVLGARWVKWLDTIIVSPNESPNFYQQRDYKILPPTIETKADANDVWAKYPAIESLPLNSVVALALHNPSSSSLFVKGYAVPGSSENIASVQVSINEGESWVPAKITYQKGRWSWTLWEVEVTDVPQSGTVFSRAIDELGRVQNKECVWNMRGVAYNAWGHNSW